ncbi:hypothetical protein C6495_11005 [Candidatus Poribacteria bacterium]|nr:MAG: hypothetical protein C6495_11005 [Candidatus Poribacteria bacterium]
MLKNAPGGEPCRKLKDSFMKSFWSRAAKARLTKRLASRTCSSPSLVILTVLIASFCLISGSIGQESFKMGVVNTQQVLEGYTKAATAIEVLRTQGNRLEKSLGDLADEIRTLQDRKAKTQRFVEEAQTADLEAEIRRKQQEYQREAELGQQGLLEEEKKLMEPIYKDIRDRIIELGKANGYDIILEKGLIVLYVDEKHELTQKVIHSLNEDTAE